MRPKKSKEPKKYAVGGAIAAGLGLGQAALGVYQMIQGQQAAKRIKEASTASPSEYAELLKQARNAELEQRRLEELNRAISTGISAAQQAGGRALVGALPGMVRAGDVGALDILGQRQAQTMQAIQFGAQGAEREIGREINREMMERQAAQAALEGGLQNIAGGASQLGSAAIYGMKSTPKKTTETIASPTQEELMRQETISSLGRTGGVQAVIGQNLVDIQEQMDEEQIPLLTPSKSKIAIEDTYRTFMLPSEMKDGGMITGGKFDHKTNPIDIVRQGKKIGEMTGGEVILNPQQQKKLSKESAYFRQLLKKFNKQK
jgi:hypothetical protein